MSEEKKINPIVLTDKETNEVYTLEFTRESVCWAQNKGFNIDEIETKPMVAIPYLFFYAFRAHHKFTKKETTDKILFEDLGGLPDGALERLAELYYLPYNTMFNSKEKDEEIKNSKMTMEF